MDLEPPMTSFGTVPSPNTESMFWQKSAWLTRPDLSECLYFSINCLISSSVRLMFNVPKHVLNYKRPPNKVNKASDIMLDYLQLLHRKTPFWVYRSRGRTLWYGPVSWVPQLAYVFQHQVQHWVRWMAWWCQNLQDMMTDQLSPLNTRLGKYILEQVSLM